MTDGVVVDLVGAARRRLAGRDTAAAVVLLEEQLRLSPGDAVAACLLAGALLTRDPARAAGFATQVAQAGSPGPEQAEALSVLGQALSVLGRPGEAVDAFSRAAALQPGSAALLCNLAVALLRAGQPAAALAAAERARALPPVLPEAHAAAGHAWNALQNHAQALECFRAALAQRPDHGDALLGVARACRGLGQASGAVVALLRACDIAPGAVEPTLDLAVALQDIGEGAAAGDVLRRGLQAQPQSLALLGNAVLHAQYDPATSEEEAAEAARHWGCVQTAAAGPALSLAAAEDSPATSRAPEPTRGAMPTVSNPAAGEGRLRIGYVSSDLYRHPVGWLGGAAIAAHDRTAVSVHVYASQGISDVLTERLRARVDSWLPAAGLDDDALARRIAADRIDVLVDLSGHTAGHRLGVFARRPARLQASWLGYPATTGLAAIDAVLMDEDHAPPGAGRWFVERLVRLPRIRFAYAPPDDAPALAPPPMRRTGRPCFGSFNNPAKLNDPVIALWAAVLRRVPAARMLLKWRSLGDQRVQARLRARFAAVGVDPARIEFEAASPHLEMLGRYAEVDVALDSFPFGGGLTTCEALWMGVPVVTLAGARPAARQGHAILRAAGLGAWSAATPEAFIEVAAGLVADPDRLQADRMGLRRRLRASALCDAEGLARALEGAYRTLVGVQR